MTVAVLLLLLGPCPALARRPYASGRTRRPTLEAAAEAARRAFEAQDAASLRRLVTPPGHDPWRVADELSARGLYDAAEAVATARSTQDVEALPRYLAARRAGGSDEPARRRRRAMQIAIDRGDRGSVLRLAQGTPPDLTRVVGVDLASGHAAALRDLGRLAEAAEAYDVVARAAEDLGWLSRTAHMLHESGSCAWRRADYPTVIDRWTRRLAVEQTREVRLAESGTLGNLGNAYRATGRYDEALALQTRALAIAEELEDRREQAQMLLNMGQVHRARGSYDDALRCFEKALALGEQLEQPGLLATTLANRGYLRSDLGRFREALADQKQALEILVTLRDRDGIARTLGNLGNLHYALGRYPEALAHLDASLRLLEERGDRAAVARMLGTLGLVHRSRGDYEEAVACYARALRLQEGLGDRVGLGTTLRRIGSLNSARGAFTEALAAYERALEVVEALGARAGVAATIAGLAGVHLERGDFARARSFFERAHAIQEELGDRAGVAASLSSLASVHAALGDFARALALYERSLEIFEAVGNPTRVARAIANIGLLYQSLGDDEKSLTWQQRALDVMEAAGNRPDVARSLGNIGGTWFRLGELDRARAYLERALLASEALGDRIGVATALANLAKVHRASRDLAAARTHLERALALLEPMGERASAASLRWDLGGILMEEGKTEEGKRLLDQALRDARSLRATPLLVRFLPQMARHRLEAGQADLALLTAQQALAAIETLLGGLGEEEGTLARAEHVDVFDVGTLAAARLDDAGAMLEFLESGRAGALLESLGGRRPLRWADVPEALHRAEAQARADEARARRAHARALDTGRLPDIRRTLGALDEALERVRTVAARFQREAKKQAGLLYPRAATLEEVQDHLRDDEALVLYSLCPGEALALVLTHDAARIVSLGNAAGIESMCRDLGTDDPREEASERIEGLRARLVDSLSLPDSVTTVLVSPEGPLCYVPFGALFTDRAVAITPSGTTHMLLKEEHRGRGTQVLALGDPDYTLDPDRAAGDIYRPGSGLVALPGTRAEAMAVGDVVLLGPDANEAKLEETIGEQKRWRAVHLACHGLVDPERPTLSSLALTRAGEADGFLTALEVLRMRIPADLAVLSACETAKGRVVKGEGILGLTRAFMYAGAPRVLCSLWKVDDEATGALMTRFYELWNADAGAPTAAEALRQAQAFVRSQEKWQHPYYWAAWVLWGLP